MTSRFNCSIKHPPTAILFFKIIPRISLVDGKLKIPNNFTRKYGGGLSNPVFLKSPDGTEWKVYWTQNESDVWFQKGWKEFATYYSLDHGHLVLFEYQETSHFHVHIFDMSALEIDYTFHVTHDQKNNLDKISEDSVEILDEHSPCQKTRLKSTMSSPQPHKKLKTATTRDVERSSKLQNFEKSPFAYVEKESSSPIAQESVETDGVKRTPVVESKSDLPSKGVNATQSTSLPVSPGPSIIGARKEAMKFTSENLFFMVDIMPGYFGVNRPCVSAVFIRKYLNYKKQIVMLKIGKKLWTVKLLYYPTNTSSKLSKGWSLFAEESKLQAGDVCIFELINREDSIFDVHIFRGH